MAVNIGPRIGIDGEAEYRKSINRIIQETKTLKSEYEKVSSAVSDNTSIYKKNSEQHKILGEQIDAQKKRISELSHMVDESTQKYGENDAKTLKWKEALYQAEVELNNLQTKLKELPSNLTLFGEEMQKAGDKIQTIGRGIETLGNTLKPVSTAAAGVMAAASKTYMDFESQMSRVEAITGATASEMDIVKEKAEEMGRTTSFTATEAGQAFEYMAMAGWKPVEMLDGIAPVMDLAAASGEDLGNVSDIVTDAITAFGLEAKDASRFTDVLAAAATNANTNVSMMGESFKYAAPVAGSLNYSIEDMALAIGLMANNGIKADMAGTGLRNLMLRMAKPTKESSAAMERLGISLADDEGNMYSFRQIMEQLRESFGHINMPIDEFNSQVAQLDAALADGTITENEYEKELEELTTQAYGAEGAEKARAAAMLAGTRAMPGLLAIVNSAEGDYNQLASAIDNSSGAAHNMAEIMLDNTKGSLTLMKSAVEGAAISLGEVFAPYIEKAANKVIELSNAFSNLDPETQKMIAGSIAAVAVAAPLIIVLGKVTTAFGAIVSGGGQVIQVLGGLSGSMTTTSAAAGTLGTSAGATSAGIAGIIGPAGIALGAIALLGGAFVTAYQNDKEFATTVNEDWAEIKATISDTIAIVKPLWEDFSKAMAPVFTEKLDEINQKLKWFNRELEGWILFLQGMLEGDGKKAWEGFSQAAGVELEATAARSNSVVEDIEKVFSEADIHLPHIKLPHFILEGTNSYGLPSFKIDWYAKAMSSGMRLTDATIFGMSDGKFLGGGEAGNEWIIGENSLMGMIRSAVRSSVGYLPEHGGNSVVIGDTQIVINAAPGQDTAEIAEAVDEIITARLEQARATWA